MIKRTHYERDHNKILQPIRYRILDEEIRYSSFFARISRTGDDGWRFHVVDNDEFDNKEEIEITLTREDVEALKDMIAKGLI